jgi:hypothetical protein
VAVVVAHGEPVGGPLGQQALQLDDGGFDGADALGGGQTCALSLLESLATIRF